MIYKKSIKVIKSQFTVLHEDKFWSGFSFKGDFQYIFNGKDTSKQQPKHARKK